ncbi:MAG TPA: hypothetical protein VJ306_24125 [Pyrinomonadaceae bacterium]|jgi:hypothetical protein|nr:hypothetical protein [Pyrinomonadaceae bacterium]
MTTIEVAVTAPQVNVKNAAEFLGSLVIMRDGLELLVNGNVNEYVTKATMQFSPLFFTPDSLLTLLREMGKVVIDNHNWPVLPEEQQLITTEMLLNASSNTGGLQLVSVNSGSLDGIFEDVFDRVGKLFRDLLGTSSSIVNGGEGAELKASLRTIIAQADQSRDIQLASAAVTMIGAEKQKRSLDAMKADALTVK